jgi:uncharacterized protein
LKERAIVNERRTVLRVLELFVYPVKSTRGLPRQRSDVESWGLRDDRRWAVVDPYGGKVTGREQRRLLTVTAVPDAHGGLTLTAPRRPPLHVPVPIAGDIVPIEFSRLHHGRAAGPTADGWLSAQLDEPVRLIWLDDPRRRPVDPAHGGRPGDVMSLADAGPLLLVSSSSLRQLDEWVAATAAERGEQVPRPLELARFRPNVVIDGGAPFSEDGWKRLRIGGVAFHVQGLCDRCVFTTINPDTLVKGAEPIRTLARRRRWRGKVWFGVWLTPDEPGVVAVGDPVEILSAQRAASR